MTGCGVVTLHFRLSSLTFMYSVRRLGYCGMVVMGALQRASSGIQDEIIGCVASGTGSGLGCVIGREILMQRIPVVGTCTSHGVWRRGERRVEKGASLSRSAIIGLGTCSVEVRGRISTRLLGAAGGSIFNPPRGPMECAMRSIKNCCHLSPAVYRQGYHAFAVGQGQVASLTRSSGAAGSFPKAVGDLPCLARVLTSSPTNAGLAGGVHARTAYLAVGRLERSPSGRTSPVFVSRCGVIPPSDKKIGDRGRY